MRDGRDFHREVELLQRDVAMRFAKRRFGLQKLKIDLAFDHDLGLRRHAQVHAAGLDHFNRHASESARHIEFVHADGQFLRPHEGHIRRAAQHHGARHGFVAGFFPGQVMQIAPGTAHARGHAHHQTVGGLERAAVGAHVLHAGFGVDRDDVGGGQRGRTVETGG